MDENNIVKEENVVKENVVITETNVLKGNQRDVKVRRIIYYMLGVLEVFFAFRLIFKVLGANPDSTFIKIIYSVTQLFLAPFNGIFRMATTEGIETESVLEPTLLIAMVVYAALAWGIVKFIEILNNRKGTETM